MENNNFNPESVAKMLEGILELILDCPFVVDSFQNSNGGTVFKIIHDESDSGKIFGKGYANINALRTIIRAVAGKYKKQIELQIAEKYEKR